MDVAAQQDIMPVTNFTQVLANKVTGVRSSAWARRGRGQDLAFAACVLLAQPASLIYIDGVRVDSRGTE